MNSLKVINQNGQLLIDSRDVAVMTDVRHADLIEKISSYKAVLDQKGDQNGEFRSDSFFQESSYSAGTGKSYKNFLLTRKGCDMVANKMTGEKGVLFTAAYVTRFEEMEKELAFPKVPLANMEHERITKLLQMLRMAERENLFTPETDRAFRKQIAESVLGSTLAPPTAVKPLPEGVLQDDDYPYTTTVIAELAGVSKRCIALLSTKHKLRVPKYSKQYGLWSNKDSVRQIRYNDAGKEKLLKLAKQWKVGR